MYCKLIKTLLVLSYILNINNRELLIVWIMPIDGSILKYFFFFSFLMFSWDSSNIFDFISIVRNIARLFLETYIKIQFFSQKHFCIAYLLIILSFRLIVDWKVNIQCYDFGAILNIDIFGSFLLFTGIGLECSNTTSTSNVVRFDKKMALLQLIPHKPTETLCQQ